MLAYIQGLVDCFALRPGVGVQQRGATLIEYALIIAAIAVVVLFGALAITGDLTSFFNTVGDELTVPAAGTG